MLFNHAKHSVSDAQLLCNYGPSYTPTNKHFFFFVYFFWPQVEVAPSTLRFTVLHNDPAAPQDHCGRRRIRPQAGTSAPEVWCTAN